MARLESIALLAVTLALCLVTQAHADNSILGIEIGKPMTLPECPKGTVVPKAACWLRDPYDKRPIGSASMTVFLTDDQAIPLGVHETIEVENIEGNVASILISTDGIGDQQHILALLRDKFGRPTRLSTQRVIARFGNGQWDVVHARWTKPGYSVEFDGANDRIDLGGIFIETDAYRREMDAAKGQKPHF